MNSMPFQKLDVYPPLPSFEGSRNALPNPILDGNPEWIEMYWKSWEIAFRGLKTPQPESPLVSNWLDEAFSKNIFQWDSIFMMLFARYSQAVFPAIESLDNFYALQRPSGYIAREYRESDGRIIHFDHGGGLFAPSGWKNTINPPLFSWAEMEAFHLSGDTARLAKVLPVLEKYARWLDRDGDPDAVDWESQGRRSLDSVHHLYWNTPLGSGMDNTPRPADKGSGWVEMSAQMVMMYDQLALICDALQDTAKATGFRERAAEISERINRFCWHEEDGFYYDVLADGQHFIKKTSGGFWPLLAGVASPEQAERLVNHLSDERSFWRPFIFPTLAADEPEYDPEGGYWLGGVWAPTNVMIIKGLQRYGFEDLAAAATEKYLTAMATVFRDSGTVFENYAPEYLQPGKPAKADFVGWTGCGPIQLLLENVMGLRPDGVNHTLRWQLRRLDRHGVERLPLGDLSVSVMCEARRDDSDPVALTIESNGALNLVVQAKAVKKELHLEAGKHQLRIDF